MLQRRHWIAATTLSLASLALPAIAADEAPDALVKRISGEVLATIKSDPAIQAGDMNRIIRSLNLRQQQSKLITPPTG